MERPILLKAHEVRGILEGRQTQLRRIIKDQPLVGRLPWVRITPQDAGWVANDAGTYRYDGFCAATGKPSVLAGPYRCPFGQVGDRLWGRESFVTGNPLDGNECFLRDENGDILPEKAWYRADDDLDEWLGDNGCVTDQVPWKSSTQMPRWISRILLEIVSVRVERLRDISDEDAYKCGVETVCESNDTVSYQYADRMSFRGAKQAFLLDQKDETAWCWVVEFKRVDA